MAKSSQESRDGSGRESASDDSPAGLPVPQTGSRPASDLPRSLGQGTNSPGAVSPLLATQSDHHSPFQPGSHSVPAIARQEGTHLAPVSLPGSRVPRRRSGTKASLPTREQPWPTRAQGRRATPPHHSSGHEVPGDGELGPLFPHKVERQFFTNPNPERNQGHVSPAGRTHDIGLSKGMCSAVAKKKKSIVF